MAKRFTDTEKWRDDWWGSLSNDYRMIWLYLVDSCTIAGIWKKDFRGLNFNCNTSITETEFSEAFKSRVVDRGNYYFIPGFLRFQYPSGLKSEKPAVLAVVRELQLNNLTQTVCKLFGNDYLIIKDKDKDKDKDKGKDKGTVKDNGKRETIFFGGTGTPYFLVDSGDPHSPLYRVATVHGMKEYFESHKSIVNNPEMAEKFMLRRNGKKMNDFGHVWNDYADFIKKQYA